MLQPIFQQPCDVVVVQAEDRMSKLDLARESKVQSATLLHCDF